MLEFFLERPFFIWVFWMLPLLGLLGYAFLSQKIIIRALLVFLVMTLPIITGYDYVITDMYGYLFYAVLICVYALLVGKIPYRGVITVGLSFLLLGVCGVGLFLSAFAGSQTNQETWFVKGYKVQSVIYRGFAGRPSKIYQLSKVGVIPVFVKVVDGRSVVDTAEICWIRFEAKRFNFNKCTPDSSYFDK